MELIRTIVAFAIELPYVFAAILVVIGGVIAAFTAK